MMIRILRALGQAFKACTDRRILVLLFIPFLLAVVIGIVLFMSLGSWWISFAGAGVEHSPLMQVLSEQWNWLTDESVSTVSYFLVTLVAILVLLPLSYLIAILLVSLVLMPFVLSVVGRRDFATLEKKDGGNFTYGLWNTLKVSALYLLALGITLPLWLVPGLAVVIPLLLSAYLNKKVFVYDVLEEYASAEERRVIEKKLRGRLYGLGVILGGLNYIPLAFVVAPTFASLAYTYFCLNALKDLREDRL